MEVLPAWLETNYAIGTLYRLMLYSKLPISLSSSHHGLAPLSSLTTLVTTPRSSSSLPLMRPQVRAPPPVSNKWPTSPCPRYSPTKPKPSIQPVLRRRKATSLPLPSLYLLNQKHLSKQRDLIGSYAFLCHLPILAPTDVSPLLRPTIMVPVHLRPLMPLFVMRPTLHTMTPLLHTLIPLPSCNSGPCHSVWGHQTPNYRTPLPSSTGSGACTPPSSNLGYPSVLKSRLLRSHVNPLHVVLLPLPFPLTPCPHMPPNHLPPALTLQLSRSLLPILPIPPLPTLLLLR